MNINYQYWILLLSIMVGHFCHIHVQKKLDHKFKRIVVTSTLTSTAAVTSHYQVVELESLCQKLPYFRWSFVAAACFLGIHVLNRCSHLCDVPMLLVSWMRHLSPNRLFFNASLFFFFIVLKNRSSKRYQSLQSFGWVAVGKIRDKKTEIPPFIVRSGIR